jgi:glycosyltransferase involved in cell wall biosynthesis
MKGNDQNAAMQQIPIKIAFVMPDMVLGGVEKALLSLLDVMEGKNFQVSLLLFRKKGELLSSVPGWVKIEVLKGAGKLEVVRRNISFFLSRIGNRRLFSISKAIYHRFASRIKTSKKNIDQRFDVAIAYKDGTATWYTAQSNLAPIKIAFIHTDFKRAGYNPISQRKVYERFDRIFCVSNASKENFLSLLPQFSTKTGVMLCAVNAKRIKDMAKIGEGFPDQFTGLRILTVGRISHEKGIDKAVEIMVKLKAAQYSVRWYIVGDGAEKEALERKAAKLQVDTDVVFLGKWVNPYRLLSDCDIYVQPSNYEGYCIALAEARSLSRPIVACDFSGAREQLEDGKTGIITGMSVDELYQGVEKVVQDKSLRFSLRHNLQKDDAQSNLQVDAFCSIIWSTISDLMSKPGIE